ncbi:MAG: ABC transporter ATP-binding protein, partial [Planctomycetes bacterium]|nr:ABC transporter ATP-binding protein [Planctomycetota bacterium]
KVSKKRIDSNPELPEEKCDRPRKLSYKEKRELETLPGRIETLEIEQEKLHKTMSDPQFYQKHKDKIVDINTRLSTLDTELTTAYQLWEALEKLQDKGAMSA